MTGPAGQFPSVWLGQSVRTTMVVSLYPAFAPMPFMASLGDAIHRPALLESVFAFGLRARLRASGPLMLDSGGFTLMARASGKLSIETVARVYATTDADLVIGLDEPPLDEDSPALRARKNRATLANLSFLAATVPSTKLVPVVHGPDLESLRDNATALQTVVADPALVALGGLVPMLRYSGASATRAAAARQHLSGAIEIVRDIFPKSRLHVLGAGAPRTVLAAFACGADSVDSIGWRRAAGYGAIFLPGLGERFVADAGRRRPTSRRLLSIEDSDLVAACGCPACASTVTVEDRIALLASHYMPRAAHNAWILLGEAQLLAEARARAGGDRPFLESRLPPGWFETA